MKTPNCWLSSFRLCLRVASLSLALWMAASSHAAFDVFIKVVTENGATMPGDSSDPAFRGADGWFEINQFSLGIQNTAMIGSIEGGVGAGKASFKEFTIRKTVTSSSPELFKAAGLGSPLQGIKVALRKSGATGGSASAAFLEYEFHLVAVTDVSWSGDSGDDLPTENVKFAFGELKISYRPQNPQGGLGTAKTGIWSILNNSAQFELPALP